MSITFPPPGGQKLLALRAGKLAELDESTRLTSVVICLPKSLFRDALHRALGGTGRTAVLITDLEPVPLACWRAIHAAYAEALPGEAPTLITAPGWHDVEQLLSEFPGLRVITIADDGRSITRSEQTIQHLSREASLEELATLLGPGPQSAVE